MTTLTEITLLKVTPRCTFELPSTDNPYMSIVRNSGVKATVVPLSVCGPEVPYGRNILEKQRNLQFKHFVYMI
jgi:hypothetical protein